VSRSIRTSLVVALGLSLAGVTLAEAARGGNVRGTARTNVNQSANVNRTANANVNRNVNANVNRNVNVDRDIDVDVDRHGGWGYHPVATGVAVGTAAAVTAAAVGSVVHALPPACSAVLVGTVTYQNCGGVWYQPQFYGTQVSYAVVTAPR
jgi:hypothetical protein